MTTITTTTNKAPPPLGTIVAKIVG